MQGIVHGKSTIAQWEKFFANTWKTKTTVVRRSPYLRRRKSLEMLASTDRFGRDGNRVITNGGHIDRAVTLRCFIGSAYDCTRDIFS